MVAEGPLSSPALLLSLSTGYEGDKGRGRAKSP